MFAAILLYIETRLNHIWYQQISQFTKYILHVYHLLLSEQNPLGRTIKQIASWYQFNNQKDHQDFNTRLVTKARKFYYSILLKYLHTRANYNK